MVIKLCVGWEYSQTPGWVPLCWGSLKDFATQHLQAVSEKALTVICVFGPNGSPDDSVFLESQVSWKEFTLGILLFSCEGSVPA